MREIILKRLETIKLFEQKFPTSTTRWRNIKIKDKHISKVDFKELSDDELVSAFEIIIRQHYKQM